MHNFKYAIFVLLGGCCYGILSTFVKLAYAAGFSVEAVTIGQYFFGTIISGTSFLFNTKRVPNLLQSLKLMALGIPFGLTGIFYYQSLQTVSASLAIIFLFQFVWLGTICDWLFHNNKPTFSKIFCLIILLVGSVLAANALTTTPISFSRQGLMWGLLSALSYTSSIYLSGVVQTKTSPLLKSFLISIGALIFVLLVFSPNLFINLNVLKEFSGYGLVLGLFGVALPPLLFSIGLPHIGPSLGTILSAIELPVAITLSVLILAETVTLLQWVGVCLILLSIIAGNINLKKIKLFDKRS